MATEFKTTLEFLKDTHRWTKVKARVADDSIEVVAVRILWPAAQVAVAVDLVTSG
jgi:hypothetical protein